MIVITGASGFIGGAVAKDLNSKGIKDLVLVDTEFGAKTLHNWGSVEHSFRMQANALFPWLVKYNDQVECIIHMGAITDTMAVDHDLVYAHNAEYSKALWIFCAHFKIPLIYASSASTYGDGSQGYSDFSIENLKPLNLYAQSKQDFDVFALSNAAPPKWYGLKFFNVYGQGERHKGRMASVVFHAGRQIENVGKVQLFKSHREGYKNGEQLRDFVYVKDVIKVIDWLRTGNAESGIYNLGTGKARTFKDLAKATFKALGKKEKITYINMPEELREKYQYFTEADITKLRRAGYDDEFYSLEDGILDYFKL